ncbi:MAG: HTH-type transcriptional activator IlvY [Pseudomonadota bacterium]
MNQRELQLFLHLAKTLSFARTSEALHVTPSSLSRVIQRLELEVGVPLFERDNRHVALTKAGQMFREFADETSNKWLDLKKNLAEQDQVLTGEISLFCSVTASYSFLYDLLSRFRLEHPGIEIKLHTGDTATTLDRIIAEQEDIGIAALPHKIPPSLCAQVLGTTPLVFIAPRSGLYSKQNLDVDKKIQWEDIPLILSESGLAREQVDRWLRDKKIKPYIYAQVAGNEAIVSMVSLGFGIGVVPKLVVDNSPLRNKIKVLDIEHNLEPFAIGVCVLQRKIQNPLIKAFWNLAGVQPPVG